jgi:cytochrome c553
MQKHLIRILVIWLFVCQSISIWGQETEVENPTVAGVEFFENNIRPVLSSQCYQCHASDAKQIKGGLVLDTRVGIRRGGDSGSAVVPNNLDESLIIGALEHESFKMPPKGKLPEKVIAAFKNWIEMGAPDPRDGDELARSVIDFDKEREYWAYQPVSLPPRPRVRDSKWPSNTIDYYTLARMESQGLRPSRAASKLSLIRRATFDLIGLPPKPTDIDAYIQDESPEAFSKVIERLLQSPHYGERWGRYWLDVARYSEDQAHTFATKPNTNGYRYRDWVISAFNRDMPYDQFVKLQIAGDLIGPTTAEPYEHIIALGFFGLGAQYYKNTDREQAMADELDDRIDTLTRGFLGLTVSCARCHDHKFDPIPTQDYYSIAGIFSSSRLNNTPLCDPGDIKEYKDGQKLIKDTDNAIKKFLADHKTTAAQSKGGEIANYMRGVWLYQSANADGQTASTAEIAKVNKLNEFLLKRWIKFLDQKNKGRIPELDEWFEVTSEDALSNTPGSTVPAAVSTVCDEFQASVMALSGVDSKGISVTNLIRPIPGETAKPGSPLFVTPPATKVRPLVGVDVDIRGATEIYLYVGDAGNGRSCDHADWISPRFVNDAGEELMLSGLPVKRSDSFGGPVVNKNYQGKKIRVGGKEYPNGIGVHATSTIVFDIPAGYSRFRAMGGLDNSGSDQAGGCGDQASVQFAVYTESPSVLPGKVGNDLLTQVLGKDGPFAIADGDIENFLSTELKVALQDLRNLHDNAKKNATPMYAIAHAYTEATPKDMRVFVRGDPANKREIAPRRFLQVLSQEVPVSYVEGSGRKELAEDIASADNPLTPRVMANRIWQHHFGRGIVNTPSNFGKLGDPPTHPELLDHLAYSFVQSGWSIKDLHREIMLSATYQQSADLNVDNSEIDADNVYFWRMNLRRLDIEAWRDALLDISGRLDPTLAGPSTNLADANNVRRTVYAKISRHELDSLLRLFDFPDANITNSKRSHTTVPQQQLFVLNSPFMIAQAKAFAARVLQEHPDSEESRIDYAFRLAYGRHSSKAETELATSYLAIEETEKNQLTRWERFAQAILAANEFMYLD